MSAPVMASDKDIARRKMKSAIDCGILVRPRVCSQCGEVSPKTLHGHHNDYARPLDVEWLCADCHIQRHMWDGPRGPQVRYPVIPAWMLELSRNEVHAVLKRHRGESTRIAVALNLSLASIYNWFYGKASSRLVEFAARKRAIELLAEERMIAAGETPSEARARALSEFALELHERRSQIDNAPGCRASAMVEDVNA